MRTYCKGLTKTEILGTYIQMSIIKIISGGQTGADRGGLDAAIKLGIPHGGYCPKGRKAEDGKIPDNYNQIESFSSNYLVRTEKNVCISNFTLIFINDRLTGGSKKTKDYCERHCIPYMIVTRIIDCMDPTVIDNVRHNITFELSKGFYLDTPFTINIAGNRESKSPGIQEYAKHFLMEVLKGIEQVEKPEETKIESLDLPEIHVDERPDWDTWFMTLAFIVSQRSLDPSTKHGCIAVDSDRTILSVGYNSPPRGCDDSKIPLTRPEKYDYMEHAESNSINNAARSGTSLKGCIFYITGEPCPACLRKMINVGCTRIIYGQIDSAMLTDDRSDVCKKMLEHTQITVVKYERADKIFQLLDKCDQYIKTKINKDQ